MPGRGAVVATSPKRIREAETKRRALELRKAGLTYEQITEWLGYASRSSAYEAVASAIQSLTFEPALEVRDLELARLDDLLAAVRARSGYRSFALDDRQQEVNHVVATVELDLGTRRVTVGPLRESLERGLNQAIYSRRLSLQPLSHIPPAWEGSLFQS